MPMEILGEIQRSANGTSFETIDQVNPKGGLNTISNYKALDQSPLRGLSYYRLKMIDEDGSFEYSPIRSILINALADKVVLYPNPLMSGQKLFIKTELRELIELRLYSADGEDIGEFEFEGDTEISLKHLPSGVYSYMLRSATWRKAGRLIVIE